LSFVPASAFIVFFSTEHKNKLEIKAKVVEVSIKSGSSGDGRGILRLTVKEFT